MKNRYLKENFEPIVKNSKNYTEILIKLGMGTKGKSRNTLKKYITLYNIDISHFETQKNRYDRTLKQNLNKRTIPLSLILISGSTYSSISVLKKRLYKEKLKKCKCEICGQDENWHGEHMSLILDHINGVNSDHRIENLRIVCPNCNATLPTFAGKNVKHIKKIKVKKFIKNTNKCKCGIEISKKANFCYKCEKVKKRKIERPEYKQLKQEINILGYCATGRKYGVSDNAIRKWIKFYEKLMLPK